MLKATKNGRSIRIPVEMKRTYCNLGYIVEPYDKPNQSEAPQEKPVTETKEVIEQENIEEMTLSELKDKAKSLGIYSKSLKTRELLIDAINKAGDKEVLA